MPSLDPEDKPYPKRVFVCGTRAVIQRGEWDFRIVCATCDGGGTVKYEVREQATRQCVNQSGRRCTICGAD